MRQNTAGQNWHSAACRVPLPENNCPAENRPHNAEAKGAPNRHGYNFMIFSSSCFLRWKNKHLKRYMVKVLLFVYFGGKDRDATNDVLSVEKTGVHWGATNDETLTTFGQKDRHATNGRF